MAFAPSPASSRSCGPSAHHGVRQPSLPQLVGRNDVVGKPIREVAAPSERDSVLAMLDRVYSTGVPHVETGARFVFERRPGGPPEERFLDYVCEPMRGADGVVYGLLSHGVDVTESKLAERRDRFMLSLTRRSAALPPLGHHRDLRAPARRVPAGQPLRVRRGRG